MKQVVLVLVLVINGCSVDTAKVCATCNRDWQQSEDPGLGPEWHWVCVPTGRMDDGEVSHWNAPYSVWSRGGEYGDFPTLEQAKKQAEKIVVERNLICGD